MRYSFSGFDFGTKMFQLNINAKHNTGIGTSNSIELGIELTPEELQELLTVLITRGKKKED
jgi:hypothetical protein